MPHPKRTLARARALIGRSAIAAAVVVGAASAASAAPAATPSAEKS